MTHAGRNVKARGRSLRRLLALAQLAGDCHRREQPMPTREDLARRFNVSPRTISRDYTILEEAHIPVQRQDGHEGVL